MKKFLILAMLTFSVNVMAQSVVGNTYKGDSHVVITDKEICRSFTDRMVLSVGLSGVRMDKEGKDIYFLDLKITSGDKITMGEGDYLILWLKGGDVIKLPAVDDTTTGMVRDIHNVNGFITHDYSAYPSFLVTAEQIEAISTKGVEKIQCNTSPNMYVKEFKKDKIGKAVAERWSLLKKEL